MSSAFTTVLLTLATLAVAGACAMQLDADNRETATRFAKIDRQGALDRAHKAQAKRDALARDPAVQIVKALRAQGFEFSVR